jgi:hypothetical protein
MSKLADAIRRSQRIESAPMGFGAARVAAKPTMLVGAVVAAAQAGAASEAGADFIVIDAKGSLSAGDAKAAREAAGDLALGALTTVADSDSAKALREAGVDFIIVDDSVPAAALLDEDLGYVLSLPKQPEELFLRSLEPLSLEALYLAETPSPLTLAGQIELSRVGGLGRKPLLAPAEASASKDDLQCLRSVGVIGVVTDAQGIPALKETVASLPARKLKRDDRAVLSLPRGKLATNNGDDDDDDRQTR